MICTYLLGSRRVNPREFLHHPPRQILPFTGFFAIRVGLELGASPRRGNRRSRGEPDIKGCHHLCFSVRSLPDLLVFHPWRGYRWQQGNKTAHPFLVLVSQWLTPSPFLVIERNYAVQCLNARMKTPILHHEHTLSPRLL